MASLWSTLCLITALLLINHKTATCDSLSPVIDDICKLVECGKGKCKSSLHTFPPYECECDNGWKQLNHDLKFLPCVTPNCTLDLTCGEAASPAQLKTPPKDNNTSFLDACHEVDCGGGFCNETIPYLLYSCDCHEGYHNLMNITTFPCFKECAFGKDCLNLGISLSNASSSLSENIKNQGLNLRGSSLWFITLMLCVSLAPWSLLYV